MNGSHSSFNSGGGDIVYRRNREIWQRVGTVLIERFPRRWYSLPLVREEKGDGCSGGALMDPLWVALLSTSSKSELMRNGMICLRSSSLL